MNKKILLLLSFISACLCMLFISQTYAKYATSASGDAIIPIARWNISVNDQTIKNNSDFSSKIVPIFPGNEYIASNIIAPSAEGYFDLNLDFSGADVSFNYNISVNPSESSSVQDLVATGYSINGGDIVTFDDMANAKISDNILYSDLIDSRSIRVFLKWVESDNSTMDNSADTLATIPDDASAYILVTLAFSQITN